MAMHCAAAARVIDKKKKKSSWVKLKAFSTNVGRPKMLSMFSGIELLSHIFTWSHILVVAR